MKVLRAAGFTLIELLVVISILSLLVVTFLPDIIAVLGSAYQANDAQQLTGRHYTWITLYKQQFGHYPEGGGHKFVLGTWVKGVCEHTPQNMAFYFTPGIREQDEHFLELKKQDAKTLWPDLQSVTDKDTHYSGRKAEMKRGMESGLEAWMANDNDGGFAFRDGSINVLYGDGQVRNLKLGDELQWTKEQGVYPGYGPEAPHPDLKKLDN